jgi:hypothetical protein
MKELRRMSLGDQVKQALDAAKLRLDPGMMTELLRELESDIEEHIERLERISSVLSPAERAQPERLAQDRRREVAFQSGSDLEDVDSLCEAFERARQILSGLQSGSGVPDLRVLFSNLPGFPGMNSADAEEQARMLEAMLKRAAKAAGRAPAPESDLESEFDFSRTVSPKNRLPRDWQP